MIIITIISGFCKAANPSMTMHVCGSKRCFDVIIFPRNKFNFAPFTDSLT